MNGVNARKLGGQLLIIAMGGKLMAIKTSKGDGKARKKCLATLYRRSQRLEKKKKKKTQGRYKIYYTRHNGIESWEIRMVRKWTLWGSITPRIESIVARYGTMIDNSRTLKEKKKN